MKILKLQATFGCLQNAELRPAPGLFALCLPNGGGKSTWAAFLLAMLYGLDTAKRSSRTALSAREQYTPWSGAPMAGRMEVDWNGRPVTIERSSEGRGTFNTFRAFDTRTGAAVPELTAENCGRLLTGAERAVYVRSAWLSARDAAVTADAALEQRLQMLVTGEEDGRSRQQAEDALKAYRSRLQHSRSGRIPELQAQLDALDAAILNRQGLQQSLQQLQAEEKALAAEQAQARAAQPQVPAQQRSAQPQGSAQTQNAARPPRSSAQPRRAGTGLLLLLLILLAAAAGILSVLYRPAGLCSLLLPLIPASLLLRQSRHPRTAAGDAADAQPPAPADGQGASPAGGQAAAPADIQTSVPAAADPVETALRENRRQQERLLGRLEAAGPDPAPRRAALQAQLEALQRQLEAADTALEALNRAGSALEARISPALQQKTTALFARLTEGRFTLVELDRDFRLRVTPAGETVSRSVLALSRGEQDLLWICLRLSLAELTVPEAPLVLDDALNALDPARQQAVLQLLQELARHRQVLLLSSRPPDGTPV